MTVISLTESKPAAKPANFAGLDAVRGLAALGVVLFHACIPYLRNPMPGLVWAVEDQSSSVVDFFYWWTELFIMPLFLVMAGFFVWKTLQRRGATNLLSSRARRLLKPLLFGVIVILPMDLYCWVLGWVAEGIVPPVKLRSLKFDAHLDQHLWGLSHLWFLQYLFLYVVVVVAAEKIVQRYESIRKISLGPRSILALIVSCGTITLYFYPEVVWGFQHDFLPVASKWIYSGLSFSLGMALAAHDAELTWTKANARRLIAPAAICSVAAVLLGQWHLEGGDNRQASVILAGLSCVSSILITMGIIGVAVKRMTHRSNLFGYLSAASFWIYMLHHPVLGLVHIDLKYLLPSLSPELKTLLACLITSGFCLATYEAFVRKTALGRWLGFDWEFPSKESFAGQESIPFPGQQQNQSQTTRRAA